MINIRTIVLTTVLVLMLVLGISPAIAAPASSVMSPLDVCTSAVVSHPLGVEGGLLSLLDSNRSTNPNPVMEILQDEAYSVHIVHVGQAAQIAYAKNTC